MHASRGGPGAPEAIVAAIRQPSDLMIMVGAAVSSIAPTCLPDAVTWVRGLLGAMADAVGPPVTSVALSSAIDIDRLATQRSASGRMAVPLEVLFQSINDAQSGLGDRLAGVVSAPEVVPNGLHLLLATAMAEGAVVVTTNFDLCLENAYSMVSDGGLRRFVAGGSQERSPQLIKVHGSADEPETLRHTIRTVDRPLDHETAGILREVWRRRTVVLGWAGADYDVLAASRPDEAGGDLFWLDLGFSDGHPARNVPWNRTVHEVAGSFSDLLDDDAHYRPEWSAVEQSSIRLMDELDWRSRYDILSKLVYQAAVAQEPLADTCRGLLRFARSESAAIGAHRSHALVGAWSQHLAGRRLPRSAWHLMLSRPARPIRNWLLSASDAVEQLQRLLGGFLLPAHAVGIVVHRLARRFARPPASTATVLGRVEPATLALREARAAAGLGLRRLESRRLDLARSLSDGDPWQTITALKRRALLAARRGDGGWPDMLERALLLAEFSSRTQEKADVLRARAVCEWYGGSAAAARVTLLEAEGLLREVPGEAGANRTRRLERALGSSFPRWALRALLRFT